MKFDEWLEELPLQTLTDELKDDISDKVEEYLKQVIRNAQKDAVTEFMKEIEDRAERKMIMTGKLEGAHYSSMKEIYDKKYNV